MKHDDIDAILDVHRLAFGDGVVAELPLDA